MKTVIRKGVFETNSSSTHSLTIRDASPKQGDEVDEDASFEIRSPLAKVIQMLGLMDKAETAFLSEARSFDEQDDAVEIKTRIVNKAREMCPEELQGVNPESIMTADLVEKFIPVLYHPDFFSLDFFEEFDDDSLKYIYTIHNVTRDVVKTFREKMFEEYCRIEGITKEEATQRIDAEAFGNMEIKEILKDKSTAEPKLRELMTKYFKFRFEFERSGETDIVAFAEEFYLTDMYEFKKMRDGRISCEIYFCEGCLDYCDCGFDSYYGISSELDIDEATSDEEMDEKVKKFLSKRSKIVAKEYYCGHIFEKPGDIY